jgi:hypothetical protein
MEVVGNVMVLLCGRGLRQSKNLTSHKVRYAWIYCDVCVPVLSKTTKGVLDTVGN